MPSVTISVWAAFLHVLGRLGINYYYNDYAFIFLYLCHYLCQESVNIFSFSFNFLYLCMQMLLFVHN